MRNVYYVGLRQDLMNAYFCLVATVVGHSEMMPPSSVSIYLNIGNRCGFVAPHGVGYLSPDFGGVNNKIPQTLKRLKEEFDFDRYRGELHQTIKTYARFLSRARRHLIEQKPAEAYLHFIIALDLLFGDKDGLTRNITKRVAVLTYLRLGLS